MMTTSEKLLKIGLPILVIILVFSGIGWLKSQTKSKEAEIQKTDIVQSYADDLKAQAKAKKNQAPKTTAQIAEALILKKTGLGAKKEGYDMTGIDPDAGVFVTQGVLKGNGIPYSSNFTGYGNSKFDLSGFDADDNAYWEKIKTDDYNKLAGNAKQQVDQYRNNNEKYQTQEITNSLRKAQFDEQKQKASKSSSDSDKPKKSSSESK